jgi:predicted acyltransferase
MSNPISTPETARLKPVQPQPANQRLMSVDALRGFDMFWIIGAEYFVVGLGEMSQSKTFGFLANQLRHKDWVGFAFYDLIFPLFVFLVGVSLVFSLSKTLRQEGKTAAHKRIFRRTLLLFAIALVYYGGFSVEWPNIRLMGVLNRIALCYFFAALIFCHFHWKAMVAICASLLLGYWALLSFVPFPDVRPVTASGELVSQEMTATNTAQLNFASTNYLRGVFEPGLNLANYIDQKYLPGKKWDKTWDPEGLLSSLPAIATCLLGVFAGLLLQNKTLSEQNKVFWLLGAGVLSVTAGFLWGLNFPVIKKIWTSSYVLVAAGYSAILLGMFHQIIEVWKQQKWAQVFVWIGANSITLYLADNVIDFYKLARRFAGGDVKNFFDSALAPGVGDLVIATIAVSLGVTLAHFLYRRKIFLRL